MKVVFILLTAIVIYCMRFHTPISATYNAAADKFPHKYLVAAALLMTFILHKEIDSD